MAKVLCGKLCEPIPKVPRYHVVTFVYCDATTVLDGFQIQGGTATSGGYNERGGGLFIVGEGPIIRNCTIRDNVASNAAGGVWINDADVTFENCMFVNNESNGAGAISNAFGSHLMLTNCDFADNRALDGQAGAIFNAAVSPADPGSGVSTVTAVNCTFKGNVALYAGAVSNHGEAIFINCLFDENHASDESSTSSAVGGALFNTRSLLLINSTITANSAGSTGAGLFETPVTSPYLDPMLITNAINCILWGNHAPVDDQSAQLHLASGRSFVHHSCVEGLTNGLLGYANIGADPLFVDPLGPDGLPGTGDESFRLQPASPCIDAGDSGAVPRGVTTDLDGLPRFVDILRIINAGRGPFPIVDMGAYEVQR